MIIAITGISGFTGQELSKVLASKGHTIVPIARKLTDDIQETEKLASIISEVDIIINLRGAPMIRRHTKKYRQILHTSRIETTRNLVSAIEIASKKPELLISASATGIYEAEKSHNEYQCSYDPGFLGQLCTEWENAALKSKQYGTRCVIVRFGIILGKNGGIVKKLLPIFRSGLGAVILPSSASFPWVHIGDVTGFISQIIEDPNCQGVFNLSADAYTTQKDFAKAFAQALKKPLLFAIPQCMLKIIFGKGAAIITQTAQINSVRLKEAAYELQFTNIYSALKDILGNTDKR